MTAKRGGWKLPVFTIALMFFYGVLLSGMQLEIARIAEHYAVDAAGIGLLVSAQFISASVAPVCAGLLADRIGKKPVLIAFSAIFGVGCAISGLSNLLWVYIVGVCVIGAGYSVCETLVSSVLGEYDPARGMQYINLSQCLLCIGAVISPILLRYCRYSLGTDWRLVFLFCAAAFLILSALLAFTAFPKKSAAAEKSDKGERHNFFASKLFICLFISILMYVGMEIGFGYFLDSLFSSLGQGGELSAIALSGYWAGMAASRLICGTRRYRAGRMLRLCFLMSTGLFVLLIINKTGWVSVLLSILIGASYGPIWTTLVGSAAAAFPERSAGAIGMMSTGCALGGILYPALMGAIAASFSFQYAFGALAITALIACGLCAIVREH